MKMARKISLASVSAIAAFALTACSSGEEADDSEPTATANTAAAPAAAPESAAPAYASLTGDAAKGEKIFIQCKTCHSAEAGKNMVGPSLHAVIGREAGEIPGYSYSAANKASHIVWSEEELYKYLEAPQKVVPGTKMTFAGLKQAQDRADVIAYLKTQS